MKIIFTHGYFIEEDARELAIMKPYVPLGLLYLSAWLEKNGNDNQIIDSTFINYNIWCDEILKSQPDVIAIYTNLMTKLNVLKMIGFIKNHPSLNKTRIILGGPEVRHHAANFLKAGSDIIVIGEGEETILELMHYYNGVIKDLYSINGIAFLDNGEAIFSSERMNLKSMDELPFPNRKKVNLQLYFDAWKSRHGESAISVSTMRGCPYTCKWCSRAVYGQTYRRRSAKLVADELEWIYKNYQVDTVWFVDDVFTISHKWLKAFADEITSRNIPVKYECITRADRMSEEVIQLLKQSGCFRVWIGAESGSQRIIDAMDRRVDVNQVREMILLTRKHGLQAGTFIMVGYPGETMHDINETIHHLKTSNPDFYTITVAYPIKGTPLYKEIENKITTKFEWAESTDRMIDFKRTYSHKFYDYAVRLIYNEVAINKSRLSTHYSFMKTIPKHLKSFAARGLMYLETLRSYNETG